MNLIYVITALSAAGAAIFAGLTWRSSKKFREEENLSRRAYLTPADEPGYMVISDDPLDIDPVVKIVLINSGTNPCKDINILMLAYNRTVVDDKSPVIFHLKTHMSNPLPKNGKLFITATKNDLKKYGYNNMHILASSFIVVSVKYTDIILQKEDTIIFHWELNDERKLAEIDPHVLDKIHAKFLQDLESFNK
ncbi:MAG: hypothetical protein H8E14_03895 [Candidatus Marinimicrobia bacterium]|nr:hypothetical protein [Candidatus Neomarinimicrobiota bacterium]